MADFELTIGTPETGSFGNKFDGMSDADGLITATFGNSGSELFLDVTGFDIDFDDEVEVRLNGSLLGNLVVGPNNDLNTGDRFAIPLARQVAGTNTLTFEQTISDSYKWGVTDILLSEASAPATDFRLVTGQTESRSFGNRFDGTSDADGVVTAGFQGTAEDLTLSLEGFDIDFATEVQVLLNGTSLGFLARGPNEALNGGDSFTIAAGDQLAGDNVLSFVQTGSPTYVWGITDILLTPAGSPPPADIALTIGVTETGEFGNRFNGNSDADGIITARFLATGSDLELSLLGFDVDFGTEVQVLLNGTPLGFLSQGPNEGFNAGDSFTIAAGAQLPGENIITIQQAVDPGYVWGFTDLLLAEAGPAFDRGLGVTTNEDVVALDGEVSLREAVMTANERPGEDTITLPLGSGRIDGSPIEVSDDLVIMGGTATSRLSSLNFQNAGGALLVGDGVTLTLEHAFVAGPFGDDRTFGVLRSTRDETLAGGDLVLNDVTFVAGGNALPIFGFDNVDFTGGEVANTGGLIGNSGSARLAGVDVRNADPFNVGMALIKADNIEINESSFIRNRLEGEALLRGETIAITNSTIANNFTGEVIYGPRGAGTVAGDVVTIASSTITGNHGEFPAIFDRPLSDDGTAAGVYAQSSLTITDSIVLGNVIHAETDNSYLQPDIRVGAGAVVTSNGNNIIGDAGLTPLAAGDQTGITADQVFDETLTIGPTNVLGGRATDNDGGTQTVALRAAIDNPALDNGDPVTAPPTDQRGTARFLDPDSGAFELQESPGGVPSPDAGFVVTTTRDAFLADGELSLREAIANANAAPGVDTIRFAPELAGATLILTNAPVEITDDVIIDGDAQNGGHASLVIDMDGRANSFRLTGGIDATFEDLTIRNFFRGEYGNYDGGLAAIEAGFGIRSGDLRSNVQLNRTAFFDNQREGYYGARSAVVYGGETVSAIDSMFIGNGGTINGANTIRLERSELRDNSHELTVLEGGDITIESSALVDNQADFGIVRADRISVSNSTLASNQLQPVYTSGDFGGRAGAIAGLDVTVSNSTITGNLGDSSAIGGIYARDQLTLHNSAVAGNIHRASYSGVDDFVRSDVRLGTDGVLVSNGANIIGQPALAGAASGDILDARTGDLFLQTAEITSFGQSTGFRGGVAANNGGPTSTVALLDDPANNPAIDGALVGDAPTTDQRGLPRDGDPDIGSFELQQTPLPATDIVLMPGIVETGEFGNRFNGLSDADGILTAGFIATGEDLEFSLTGYDIDYATEVEILLNGTSLGFLSQGPNEGFNGGDSFTITMQQPGANVISIVQDVPRYVWGVTDLLLNEAGAPPPVPTDIVLTPGVTDTASYGNRFDGLSDADGVITIGFEGAGDDLVFSLDGYDIDYPTEVEVLLNGTSLGFLSQGPNEGFNGGDSFAISTAMQQPGTNVISIVQDVPRYVWGMTDLRLDAANGALTSNPSTAGLDPEDIFADSETLFAGGGRSPDSFALADPGPAESLSDLIHGEDVIV